MDGLSGTRIGASLDGMLSKLQEQRAAEAQRWGDRVDGSKSAEAAEQLEGLFAQLMVKELRGGLADGLFGEGPGKDVFEGWFDRELGRSLGESGVLDMAGMLKAALGEEGEEQQP